MKSIADVQRVYRFAGTRVLEPVTRPYSGSIRPQPDAELRARLEYRRKNTIETLHRRQSGQTILFGAEYYG